MRTRVGITTDENERKQYWKGREPKFTNWKIVKRNLTKEQAQSMETDLKNRYGYEAAPGGPDASGKSWSVYTFDF